MAEAKVICGTCGGSPEETDIGCCYHCGNTGYISPEEARRDKISGLVGHIAANLVGKQKQACNDDPDSDGWGLHAAENMLSEYEYTQSRIYDEGDRILKVFIEMDDKLGCSTMDYLVELLGRGLDAPVPQPEKPKIEPLDNSEIPF